MSRRNAIPLLALLGSIFVIAFYFSDIHNSEAWRGLPQHVGLGDHVGSNAPPSSSGSADLSQGKNSDPDYANWNPKPVFKSGSPMPAGHNYTSTLVIAKTKKENVDWIRELMPEQETAIYVADDPTAPLHPPKNKGHEVMIYLSWIIDNYDNLPDVAIFMHAHQLAWHNDDMLEKDAHLLVTRLSRPRVWREGYVNMRCKWEPGCPAWMHPGATNVDGQKPEEVLLAKSWSELFPLDEVPTVLAQPCCAQFALSRERIQARPYAQYVWYRDWMFNTQLPDYLSGRIWEYVWQFVFTGQNINCPKEHICLCDQYGACFGGEEEYANFLALQTEFNDQRERLKEWDEKSFAIEDARRNGDEEALKTLEIPQPGESEEYMKEINRLQPILDKLKHEAEIRGQDPRNRALEAGREWKEVPSSHMFARHDPNNTNQPNARTPIPAATDLGPLVGRLSLTHDSKRQHPKSGAQSSAGLFSTLACQTSPGSSSSAPLCQIPRPIWDKLRSALFPSDQPMLYFLEQIANSAVQRSNRKPCICFDVKPNLVGSYIQKSFDVTLDGMSDRVIPIQLA
ncbi:DUF3431 domain containing protein [Pyrenophora tritici-repentis]|nr:hypothetical protein PtrARCrB10_04985 [Pyrenophora tritici-repentis]PZC95203.1 DUF3431 domain containing protein [Pyrenophora tritici-repentis]